jgi:hypothetical protein
MATKRNGGVIDPWTAAVKQPAMRHYELIITELHIGGNKSVAFPQYFVKLF